MRGYSQDIEFWSVDSGETAFGTQRRAILHDLRGEMTAQQLNDLASLDKQARALFAKHRGDADPHDDIRALEVFVRIADSEISVAAA